MAVNDQTTPQATATGQAFHQAAAAASSQGAPQQKGQWRAGLGSLAQMAMGRSPQSEVMTKLDKELTELYAPAQSVVQIHTLPLDRSNNPSMGLSALVVVMHNRVTGNNKPGLVAVHTLIIEDSAMPFEPLFIKTPNKSSTEVKRVAGDAFDVNMRNVVEQAVARQFSGVAQVDCGACVVPRGFFENKDSTISYTLAANAAIACNTGLEESRGSDFKDLSLKDMAIDPSLTVKVQFHQEQTMDAVGLPVRADIQIAFSAGGSQQQGGPIESPRLLTEVQGFMDLQYEPQAEQTNMFIAQPQSASRATYVQHFVMTNMQSIELQTLPAQLLALATASVLRENNVGTMALAPKATSESQDLKDIGAIGLEVNIAADGTSMAFDTKSDQFRPDHFAQMIQAFFHQGMVVSLDVPECGAQSWFNDVFIAAGENIPEANQTIIDAANYLTNDRFSHHYALLGGTGSPVTNNNNRIHMGFWTDRQGRKVDIRSIDYLAVLNLFPLDPQQIAAWSNSHLNTSQDLNERLEARWKLLQALPVTLTGYARRLTFESKFLDALLKACLDMKLTMRPQFQHSETTGAGRATGHFAQSGALLSTGITGMFSGNTQTTTQGGTATQGFNRWRA